MGLLNPVNVLNTYLIIIAQKIKKEINQFKFIFDNHNIKITNTINYKIYKNNPNNNVITFPIFLLSTVNASDPIKLSAAAEFDCSIIS
jgi:hypothetical protein